MPIQYRVDEGYPYPTGELARKGDGRYLLERELDGVQIHAVVRGGHLRHASRPQQVLHLRADRLRLHLL